VGAAFRRPSLRIIIEPSMGFGTGHHQSTRLCLLALQSLPLAGARVVDVGTGSGVLAIAAALLSATEVEALDNDPDAVAAARENVTRNGVADCVRVLDAGDVAASAVAPAGVVVANLTAWTLRQHAASLHALVAPGGRLIVSGFTHDQVRLVLEAFPGLIVVERFDEDDWLALVLGT
jgi:ribosomal protein L11 methyltransferase